MTKDVLREIEAIRNEKVRSLVKHIDNVITESEIGKDIVCCCDRALQPAVNYVLGLRGVSGEAFLIEFEDGSDSTVIVTEVPEAFHSADRRTIIIMLKPFDPNSTTVYLQERGFDSVIFIDEDSIPEWGGHVVDFQSDDKPLQPITAGVGKLHAVIDAGLAITDRTTIDMRAQHVLVDCDVYLETRATHMSRVAQTIEAGGKSIEEIVKGVKEALGDDAKIDMKFSFEALASSSAPVSGRKTVHPLKVDVEYVEIDSHGREPKLSFTVSTTGTSCCPCSRNMSLLVNNLTHKERFELFAGISSNTLIDKLVNSGFGAHNQRSILTTTVVIKQTNKDAFAWVNIAEIYNALVDAFSAPVVNILKRPDEKYQTELMYNGRVINGDTYEFSDRIGEFGAKFSEDIARNAFDNVLECFDENSLCSLSIVCENEESIHTSNAVSKVSEVF